MSFPSPITELKLFVSTGSPPNVQSFEQTISSANMGSNSVQITNNNGLLTAFNSQEQGTIFNASITTTYAPNTFPSGNIIPVPSVSNFVPRQIPTNLSLSQSSLTKNTLDAGFQISPSHFQLSSLVIPVSYTHLTLPTILRV